MIDEATEFILAGRHLVSGQVSNFPFWRRLRRRHQLPDRVEDDLELLVMFTQLPFDFFQLAGKFLVRCQYLAQLHKRPHDGDVDFDRTVTVENAGKHRHALLGEGVGQSAAATTALGLFDVPGWNVKASTSALLKRNMNSSGNRSKLRFTALFRFDVVTR